MDKSDLPAPAVPAQETRSVILHYHLFKNAGTSLDALLQKQFPGRWVAREFHGVPDRVREKTVQWVMGAPDAVCFSSHTALLPPPEIAGVSVVPVVFIRHPLDRIASAYAFESKQNDAGFGSTLARNTSLRGYIETRLSIPRDAQCRNFHVERLASMFPSEDGTPLERALEAVQALPFVGLVEAFDDSLARLQALLQSSGLHVELQSIQRNVSGRSASLEERLEQMASDLGPDLYHELQRLNEDDLALHRKVSERFPGVGHP